MRNRFPHYVRLTFTIFIATTLSTLPDSIHAENQTEPQTKMAEFGQFSKDVGSQGDFRTSASVSLPPGLGGVTPSLGLSYSSDAGNGLAGYGWRVAGMECVERRGPSRTFAGVNGKITTYPAGAPEYAGSDVFYYEGQRLIPCAGQGGSCNVGSSAGTFRTEFDSFAKIEYAGTSWTVTERDGTQKIFSTRWDRVPGDSGSWFRMCLSSVNKVGLPASAAIQYTYRDPSQFAPMIDTISYGGTPGVRVKFSYEARPDPRESFFFGRLERTPDRLASILVEADPGSKQLSKLQLVYTQQGSDPSFLSQIQTCGTDCSQPDTYSYSYATRGSESAWNSSLVDSGLPSDWHPYWPTVKVTDVNADGLPDLVKPNSKQVYYNIGSSTFVPSNDSRIAHNRVDLTDLAFPAGSRSESFPLYLTGNRYPDLLMVAADPGAPLQKRLFSVDEDHPSGPKYKENLNFNTATIPDLVTVRNVMTGTTMPSQSQPPYEGQVNYTSTIEPTNRKLADVNGDGLQDIVEPSGAHINFGDRFVWRPGNAGPSVAFQGSFTPVNTQSDDYVPFTPDTQLRPNGILFTDVNGDGLDDVVQSLEERTYSHSYDAAFSCMGPSSSLSSYQVGDVTRDARVLINTGGTTPWLHRSLSYFEFPYQVNEFSDTYVDNPQYQYEIPGCPPPSCLTIPGLNRADCCPSWWPSNYDCDPWREGAGNTYTQQHYHYLDRSKSEGFYLADVNHDGLSDIVQSFELNANTASSHLVGSPTFSRLISKVFLSNGSSFSNTSDPLLEPQDPLKKCLLDTTGDACQYSGPDVGATIDLTGDGISDILRADGKIRTAFASQGPNLNKLVQINNPIGGKQFIAYASVTNSSENPGLQVRKTAVSKICISDGTSQSSQSLACTGSTDVEITYAYKGGEFDTVRRNFSGFRYVRKTAGKVTPPGGVTYRPMSETWYRTDWCHAGSPEFAIESSIRDGKSAACEHRDANFNFDSANPQNVIDPTNCSVGSDSHVLKTSQMISMNEGASACPAYNANKPLFYPVVSVISKDFDPANSLSIDRQNVTVFSAADLERGRPSESCLYDVPDPNRLDCASGYQSKQKSYWVNPTSSSTWILDRSCKSESFDSSSALIGTSRLWYVSGGTHSCDVSGSSNGFWAPVQAETLDSGSNLVGRTQTFYDTLGLPTAVANYNTSSQVVFSLKTWYRGALVQKECVTSSFGGSCPPASGNGYLTGDYLYEDQVGGLPNPIPFRLYSATDGSGNVSKTVVDSQGRPTSAEVRSAAGVVLSMTSYTYNQLGSPNSQYVSSTSLFSTTPTLKQLTNRSYFDGLGRSRKAESVGGPHLMSSSTEYNQAGMSFKTYAPHKQGPTSGSRAETKFDRFGRPYQIYANGNLISTNTYGLTQKSGETYSFVSTVVENPGATGTQTQQQKRVLTNWLGQTRFSYDEFISDPNNRKVEFVYNARGQLWKTLLPDKATPTTQYVQTEIGYDDLGRKVWMEDADLSNCTVRSECRWEYAYDWAGRLTRQKDAKGNVTRFLFDPYGRQRYRTNCAVDDGTGNLKTEKFSFTQFYTTHLDRMNFRFDVDPAQMATGGLRTEVEAICTAHVNDTDSALMTYLDGIDGIEDQFGQNPNPNKPNLKAQGAQYLTLNSYNPNGTVYVNNTEVKVPMNLDSPTGAKFYSKSIEVYTRNINNISGGLYRKQVINYHSSDGSNWTALETDTLTSTYDAFGRSLDTVSTFADRSVTNRQYGDDGALISQNLGTSGTVTYQYENDPNSIDRGRLRSISYSFPGKGSYVLQGYTYDAVGNIKNYDVQFSPIGGTFPGFTVKKQFTYDVHNQLASYQYGTASNPTAYAEGAFSYDILSNRIDSLVSETIHSTPLQGSSGGGGPGVGEL